MNIHFQDKSQKTSCWNCQGVDQTEAAPKQVRLKTLQEVEHQRPHKISLKKLCPGKNKSKRTILPASLHPTECLSTQRTQQSEAVREKPLERKVVPLGPKTSKENSLIQTDLSQGKYLIPPQQSYVRTEQIKSALTERQSKKSLSPPSMAQTMLSQPRKWEDLSRTIKMIPHNNKSLDELSKMKNSVITIMGPEEKPRVEESVILIDFFKGNSGVTQIRASSHLK